uniref:SAM domain-containing protein n=1 Tax=Phytophthora ramorum TaxID=164328 RepID=H3GL80_PHYRM
MARRNLALSQLTNPGTPLAGGNLLPHDRNSAARASAPSLQMRSGLQPGGYNHEEKDEEEEEEEEDEEDEEEEYDEDDDDDQLTLAQDVGVPDVVPPTSTDAMLAVQNRFQQKQCNGEMLLELTESDLINDFSVKDRIQRERILNAIEAIKTSDVFSDEEDEDDEDDEDDLEESEEYGEAASPTTHMRHSMGGEMACR